MVKLNYNFISDQKYQKEHNWLRYCCNLNRNIKKWIKKTFIFILLYSLFTEANWGNLSISWRPASDTFLLAIVLALTEALATATLACTHTGAQACLPPKVCILMLVWVQLYCAWPRPGSPAQTNYKQSVVSFFMLWHCLWSQLISLWLMNLSQKHLTV